MKLFSPKSDAKPRESFIIEEKDIYSDLKGDKGSCLFLGKYSLTEVSAVLKKRNFFKDAQKKGLWPLEYHMDVSEYPLQRFQIFFKEKKQENLVVDLKLKEGSFQPKEKFSSVFPLPRFTLLHLEWLTLQNPLLEFSGDLSPLPGQKHPGLNLGSKVLDLFIYLARLCKLDGLLAYPAYFHNAILFSRYFSFLNPEKQGEVLGIRKTFRRVPFKQLAWIVYLDCLREKSSGIYKWGAEEQVYPLNKVLKAYLESRQYKSTVKESMGKSQFEIDWECYKRKQGPE
jgi:hypothetical protein